MFNLDQAITEWRKQMLAAGIQTPVPLDELESHLREDVEQQMRSGLSAQQAFAGAVCQMGPAGALKREFKKVEGTIERKQMKRIAVIIAGLFGMLFGFAMIWPLLGQWHRTGEMRHAAVLMLGTVLVIVAGSAVFYNIKRNQEIQGRKLIGSCLIIVGGFCSAINATILFDLNSTGRLWWLPAVVATVLFFGSCFHFNRTLPSRPALEG